MIRRSLILCAAVALIAAGSAFAPSPAHAYYRVIKWPVSNFCQIWDYAIPTRPWPHSYRVVYPAAAQPRRRAGGEGPLFPPLGMRLLRPPRTAAARLTKT